MKLKVTFVKSTIGGTARQKETIKSLGLRKLHQSRIVEDTPVFRGMINRVSHLLKVEEIKE